ncbi:MAG: hypothetical protein AAF725_10530, partial [Acidobacteriota bacterium]
MTSPDPRFFGTQTRFAANLERKLSLENQRLMLAAILSVGIVLVWQTIFAPPPPVREPAPTEIAESVEGGEGIEDGGEESSSSEGFLSSAQGQDPKDASADPAELVRVEGESAEEITIKTEKATAVFTNSGAQLLSYRINSQQDEQGEPFELVRLRG